MSSNASPLRELEFVAFDLETTGLHAMACRIVEIGAARIQLGGAELDRFEPLVDPKTYRLDRILDFRIVGG